MVAAPSNEPHGGTRETIADDASAAATRRPLIVAKGDDATRSPAVPILFVRNKKRRRERYSKGTKDLQRLQRAVTRASYRLSSAATLGLESFDRNSRKSARKKRDGALADGIENAAAGLRESLREASSVPVDVAKGINRRLIVRGAKYTARLVVPNALQR